LPNQWAAQIAKCMPEASIAKILPKSQRRPPVLEIRITSTSNYARLAKQTGKTGGYHSA
jgi:hypothetical protein